MPSTSQFRVILSICDKSALRWSRELLLKEAGYEVHSFASNERPGMSLVRRAHLAIICDSIGWRRAGAIHDALMFCNPTLRCLDLARETHFGEGGGKIIGGADFRKLVDEFVRRPTETEPLPSQ